jgi:hypothetical protein
MRNSIAALVRFIRRKFPKLYTGLRSAKIVNYLYHRFTRQNVVTSASLKSSVEFEANTNTSMYVNIFEQKIMIETAKWKLGKQINEQ